MADNVLRRCVQNVADSTMPHSGHYCSHQITNIFWIYCFACFCYSCAGLLPLRRSPSLFFCFLASLRLFAYLEEPKSLTLRSFHTLLWCFICLCCFHSQFHNIGNLPIVFLSSHRSRFSKLRSYFPLVTSALSSSATCGRWAMLSYVDDSSSSSTKNGTPSIT